MRVTGGGYGGADGGSAAARAVESAIGADVTAIQSDLRRQGGPSLGAVAALLGVSTSALQSDLGTGQTLATIARAHGKSAADVDGALLAGVQAKLTGAVTAGTMSQQLADTLLRSVRTRVDRLVAGNASSITPIARGVGPNLLDALSGDEPAGDAQSGALGALGQAGSPSLIDLLAPRSAPGRTTINRATAGGLADFLAKQDRPGGGWERLVARGPGWRDTNRGGRREHAREPLAADDAAHRYALRRRFYGRHRPS